MERRDDALDFVARYPTCTLQEIRTELQVQHPLRPIVSTSTIFRKLDGELITLKNAYPQPADLNTALQKASRIEFVMSFSNSSNSQDSQFIPIYEDECGFSLWTHRLLWILHCTIKRVDRMYRQTGLCLYVIVSLCPFRIQLCFIVIPLCPFEILLCLIDRKTL